MLTELRDYLKEKGVAEHYSIGKINNSQYKAIGVYGNTPLAQVESIGRNSSYGISSVRILLHWTKNLAETEEAAHALYRALKELTDTNVGGYHIQYAYLPLEEATFVGTDDNGVYEYVIPLELYYRR